MKKTFFNIQAVSDKEIVQQKPAFTALLQNLGKASFAEIEQTLREREPVAPEPGLTPEIVQRLRERIANQKRRNGN